MNEIQLQMKADIVAAPDGTQHVRVVVQFGPVATILILPPDAMAHVCEQYAQVAAVTVPEARRMNEMPGFQIISGDAMPKLPPLNGSMGGM